MNWKELFFCTHLFFISLYVFPQTERGGNLIEGDTTKVNMLLEQSKEQLGKDPDKAIEIATRAKELAENMNFLKGQANALKYIGIGYFRQGIYLETLGYWRESLNIFESIKDETGIANILNNMAAVYSLQGNEEKALENSLQSLKISEKLGDKLRILSALNTIANIYYDKPATKDKALSYLLRALPLSEEIGNSEAVGLISVNIGEIYFDKGDDSKALEYFNKSIKQSGDSAAGSFAINSIAKVYLRKGDIEQALKYNNLALRIAEKKGDKLKVMRSLMDIANVYVKKNDLTIALNYYNRSEVLAKEVNSKSDLKRLYGEMAKTYEKTGDFKNAYAYQIHLAGIKDSLFNASTEQKLGSLQFLSDMQKRDDSVLLAKNLGLQQLRFDKFASQNKLRTYLLLSGLTVLLIVAVFLYRNNRQKQKAKSKIEQAFSELKNTQQQLIHREKMASLGELTAGIAHEIQNPLNFVNNFSEVSNELIDEMHREIETGNTSEIKQIATDIKQNLEKINHHGKRADAIVKGMLQHSRSSTGDKAPTNINALADEYLRLAYHGLRATDKSFNATMQKNYDEKIGNINIIPQDIGRVILNLITNAFYAVREKKNKISEGYEPVVSVITKKLNGKVEIKVKDNGDGIPQKILDKIFQPFFTTKPTGQGTGLGLSLSYDIVKAHRGELKVETKEGEGAEFSIQLPYN